MYRVITAELCGSIWRALRWWKIALFVIITGLFAAIVVAESKSTDHNLVIYKLYAPFWIRYIIKPRISKINYLLPGDEKSRETYLKYFFVGMLLLFILWFASIYLIAISIGGISGLYAVKRVLCSDIVYLAYLCIIDIMTVYELKIKRKNTWKDNLKFAFILVSVTYSSFHAVILYSILSGSWLIVTTVLSYLFMIPFLYHYLSQIKYYDTGYEGIRKPLKQTA